MESARYKNATLTAGPPVDESAWADEPDDAPGGGVCPDGAEPDASDEPPPDAEPEPEDEPCPEGADPCEPDESEPPWSGVAAAPPPSEGAWPLCWPSEGSGLAPCAPAASPCEDEPFGVGFCAASPDCPVVGAAPLAASPLAGSAASFAGALHGADGISGSGLTPIPLPAVATSITTALKAIATSADNAATITALR